MLYAEIRRSLQQADIDLPPYHEMRRVKPGTIAQVQATGTQLNASITALFPSLSRPERDAMRAFLVDCARQRVHEARMAAPITFYRVLDALIPLEELLDDRFPGYRESGQLAPTLLAFLGRKVNTHVRT